MNFNLLTFLTGIFFSGFFVALLLHFRNTAKLASLQERLQGREEFAQTQANVLEGQRAELQDVQKRHTEDQGKIRELEAILEAERKNLAEKITVFKETEEKLTQAFKALSAEALERNNASFMHFPKASFEKQKK